MRGGIDSRIWRRRLIAIAVMVLALFALYHFWLRDSSLFAIDEVKVDGATTAQDQIQKSLTAASADMTTLHIDDTKLAQAVSGIPTVASIKADASLPSELTVTVTERLPVAVVKVHGETIAVSDSGLLLPGLSVHGEGLPRIDTGPVKGGQLDPEATAQAQIAGAAPEDLRRGINDIAWSEDEGGVVVDLEGAPELRFGDGEDADQKWQAVAAVLLDGDARSAGYVNVIVPERPVTGG